MEEQKYPQDEEQNEYRYISPSWVDAIACGLTAGAKKHPGETWKIFRRTSIFPGRNMENDSARRTPFPCYASHQPLPHGGQD